MTASNGAPASRTTSAKTESAPSARQDNPTMACPWGSRCSLTSPATWSLTSGARLRCPVMPIRIT